MVMADPRSSSARMIAERLRVGAAPPSSAHPDANLLTAFAESSLNERERARVVEHLAHCAVCRDVVYLAQPEIEAPLPATAVSPAPIRWFAWRRLQWAALAASLSLVVALAILVREDYQRGSVLTGRVANETTGPQTVAQSQAKNDANRKPRQCDAGKPDCVSIHAAIRRQLSAAITVAPPSMCHNIATAPRSIRVVVRLAPSFSGIEQY